MNNSSDVAKIELPLSILQGLMDEFVTRKRYLEQVQVGFLDGFIQVSGITKVTAIKGKFETKLKIVGCEERKVFFEVIEISPKLVLPKLLAVMSYVSYKGDVITLDLNKVKKMKNISIGKMKDVKIQDDCLLVHFTL